MNKQITLADFVAKDDKLEKENTILVVDIETTATRFHEGYIVEIGICKLNLDDGKITPIFDSIVREKGFSERDQNAWIFQNSNLKFEDVLKSPEFDTVKPQIRKIFENTPSTAYNKRFDFGWLRSRGLEIVELPCPMIAATPILQLPPKYEEFDFKYPKVEEAWDYYYPDLDYIEKHRAYDDAEHEAMIIYAMYKLKHWEPIIEDLKKSRS